MLHLLVFDAEASWTTRPDTRPVAAAFAEARRMWDFPLCYEDAALSEHWAEAVELALLGVVPDAVRSLDLRDLRQSSVEEVAASILALADTADPLLRFELQDVGGCVTAVPNERRWVDGIMWEPVVPVLDRTIDLPAASTYRAAIGGFADAMAATGLDFRLSFGWRSEVPCAVPRGQRVAREALGEIIRCLPEGALLHADYRRTPVDPAFPSTVGVESSRASTLNPQPSTLNSSTCGCSLSPGAGMSTGPSPTSPRASRWEVRPEWP